jgi:hypothetical protein
MVANRQSGQGQQVVWWRVSKGARRGLRAFFAYISLAVWARSVGSLAVWVRSVGSLAVWARSVGQPGSLGAVCGQPGNLGAVWARVC